MPAPLDPGSVGDRIGELLDELAAALDPAALARLGELLGLVAEVHAAALARVLELAGRQAGDDDLLATLAGDELVASVLAGHGLAAPAPVPAAGVPVALTPRERCDLCGASLGSDHDHLVRLEPRQLVCACRPCSLLFDHEAAAGTHRAVGDRWAAFEALDEAWEALDVPVGLAFFVANSTTGGVDAGYPGPAGVTASLLDLDAWDLVAARHPELHTLRPDVEAVLVHRDRDGGEAFIVPVDACYALAGELRSRWRGFDGGPEVRAAVDAFLERARARAGVRCEPA